MRWHNDRRALRDVRMRGRHPDLRPGRASTAPSGCRDLMEAGAIDVCNFDASWSGGPTAWRRAAAIATSFDVEMGHHEEPQVAAHLIASQPHGTYAECFHPDRDPFWWNLVANRTPNRRRQAPAARRSWPGLDPRRGLHRRAPGRPAMNAGRPHRVGIAEVAEHAGVAVSSVSRVVSGHPDVSERMRTRVLAAIEELGFVPDVTAQSLRTGSTKTVGFVVSDIRNPLIAEIAHTAETRLARARLRAAVDERAARSRARGRAPAQAAPSVGSTAC